MIIRMIGGIFIYTASVILMGKSIPNNRDANRIFVISSLTGFASVYVIISTLVKLMQTAF